MISYLAGGCALILVPAAGYAQSDLEKKLAEAQAVNEPRKQPRILELKRKLGLLH